MIRYLCAAAVLIICLVGSVLAAPALCRIEVVEKGSGWPVPLVELRTTHNARLVTDNAGLIACDLQELFGKDVWFDVLSPGYEVPKDGFGYRGVRLRIEAGGKCRVEVVRTALARRLGRLTGAGLFAESQKLGEHKDWRDSGIFGCDSIQFARHGDKLFWAWGDTTMPGYPLGIFDMTAATTGLRPLASFEPPLKLALKYFTDTNGLPRAVAKIPGSGPSWLSGFVSLPDAQSGRERLVACYAKIKPPMEAYERGLCVWDDESENFKHLKTIWRGTNGNAHPQQVSMPDGHASLWEHDGKREILFGNPLPNIRCPATFEAWSDPASWQKIVPPEHLLAGGGEEKVKPHSGSIAWSAYLKRWVTVFMQAFGKPSVFGEIWYAEAASPWGPWSKAVKILSHSNYTFYNPRIHPELSPPEASFLIFEGTYTAEFADRPQVTPRYNYNQVLYRLDLDNADLTMKLTLDRL